MSSQFVFAHAPAFGAMLLIVVALAFATVIRLAPMSPRFKALPVMTPNEAEFYGRLSRALPDCFVCPQVAMSALVTPSSTNKSKHLAAFRSISQKRVDYALLAQDFSLVCVVELDDRTHDRQRDARRDACLASAGIKTVRWESRGKPSETQIRQTVLGLARQNA